MGFHAQQGGSKTYYSLLIDAARAEIEHMAEPRNPAHVLGVGAQVESVNGPVFAAYFAASREKFDTQPNYRNGLFVLVDGAVYAVKAENIDTTTASTMPASSQRLPPVRGYEVEDIG